MLEKIYKKIEQKDYKTREKIRNIFIGLAFLLIIASWIIYNKYSDSKFDYKKINNNQAIVSGREKLRQIGKARGEIKQMVGDIFTQLKK